jgi:hypothetical protein
MVFLCWLSFWLTVAGGGMKNEFVEAMPSAILVLPASLPPSMAPPAANAIRAALLLPEVPSSVELVVVPPAALSAGVMVVALLPLELLADGKELLPQKDDKSDGNAGGKSASCCCCCCCCCCS